MRRFSVVVALVILLAGCSVPLPPAHGAREESNIVPEWTLDAPPPQAQAVEPGGAPAHFDVAAIRAEAGDAAGAVADIYRAVERYDGIEAAYLPTEEERRRIVGVLGERGYVAVADEADMVNADALMRFYRLVEEGGAGHVGVYTLGSHGQLTRWCLGTADGAAYSARLDVEFGADGAPVVGDVVTESELDYLFLTDKGFLIFGNEGAGWDGMAHGFRVEPLGQEYRELARLYIDPLRGYNGHNILVESWDGGGMDALSYNDVFEMLYEHDTGLRAQEVFTELYDGETMYVLAVPADEFEAVMLRHFDIGAAALREWAVYDAQRRVYAWQPLVNGGFMPYYEVVDAVVNADGSMTLEVHPYSIRHRSDRLATNYLTVRTGEDGAAVYLGNRVEAGVQFGLIPGYQVRVSR